MSTNRFSDQRINILHASDLHYDNKNQFNIEKVLDAFRRAVEKDSLSNLTPHLAVFSGDAVKRGDDVDDFVHVSAVLSDRFGSLDCGNSIFVVPGNHDVQRTVVEKTRDLHTKIRALKSRDELNDLAYTPDVVEMIANKFSNYRGFERTIRSSYLSDEDHYYSTYYVSALDVSVVCFNTACFSTGGLGGVSDEGYLAIPEIAISNAVKRLPKATRRILVTHHPLSFLAPHSRADVERIVRANFDVHLFGHVHEADPSQVVTMQGSTFVNQSGALFTDRARPNGFSIISLDLETPHVELNLRTYFDTRSEFGVGENLRPGGKFYSSPEAEAHWKQGRKQIDEEAYLAWLRHKVRPALQGQFNQGLAERPISELFVEPPLSSRASFDPTSVETDELCSISQILDGNDSYALVGKREFGKTTLLQQIALRSLEAADDAIRLPCFVNFSDLKPGEGRVGRALRASIPIEFPPAVELEHLLDRGLVLVIVDDVTHKNVKSLQVLRALIQQYPKNKYILSSPSEMYEELGAVAELDLPIPFTYLFLQDFSRNRLRDLVNRWGLASGEDPDLTLNRVVATIVQINIPLNAVSGTILLTIYENSSDFGPMNRAVLLGQFIESLLHKWSPEDARRSNYDFTFKTHYLAHIASKMTYKSDYVLDYSQIYSLTDEYFSELGMKERADAWVNQFISAKIFVDRGIGISFKYRAFCEYFIALQMSIDETFKSYILEDENYLSFINEIEYFSAIKRNDASLLNLIEKRHSDIQARLLKDLEWNPNIDLFNSFRRPRQPSPERVFEAVEREMQLPTITPEERDAILQSEIPKNVGFRQEIFRPHVSDDAERWNMSLFLYSRVLKNSELISGADKKRHLENILSGWAVFSMFTMLAIPTLVKHRRILLNGVKYVVRMPASMPDEEVAENIYLAIPRATGRLLALMLGNEKLRDQLATASADPSKPEPLIVRFYRTFLYADLRLPGFVDELTELAASLRRSGYLKEAMLSRLREIFYRMPLSQRQNERLRRLTSEIATDLYAPPTADKAGSVERRIHAQRTRELVRDLHHKGSAPDEAGKP